MTKLPLRCLPARRVMRLLLCNVLCAAFAASSFCHAASAPVLSDNIGRVKAVYVFQMGYGLDQYLANRLARSGRFQVVTDPQLADSLLTDHLGGSFEQKYIALYPPPPAPNDSKKDSSLQAAMIVPPDDRPLTTFGRSRGNIFLVDRADKRVLWSFYKRPKYYTPENLDKLAAEVVRKLLADATPPKKQ